MAITNGTNITALEKPAVGVDTGPAWATALNASIDATDGHDHTTNKGSRITPAAINVNADLEMNSYDLTEIRTLSLNSTSDTVSGDTRAIYANGANNLIYRNASGNEVQITDGDNVAGAQGTITGMTSVTPNASATYTNTNKTYNFFKNQSSQYAYFAHSDIFLYKYQSDGTSTASDTDYVKLQVQSDASGNSGTLTVPTETGTLLSTSSSVSDISVTSTTASKPDVVFANNANDATGPVLNLKNLRGGSNAGVANDDCGTINFYANDAANNNQIYSSILAEISDPTSGGEEGKISISVAEYDGTVTPGFILTGTAADGIVDATIGAGATSTTSIAGTLDLGDRAILNVGDIDCDSISVADAAIGLNIDFGGNTTKNLISLTDHLADALNITEGSNSYIKFITTNSSEQIVFGQNSTFNGTTIADLGTVTTADINGGTIDGATIATSDVTVGAGKTLDVSAGTLTTSTAQKQAISSTAFASGTKMIFQQTAAPTGWTKVTGSGNDTALRVTTGTVGTGGSVAFETAFASQTPSQSGSASVSGHVLAENEMPSHLHSIGVSSSLPGHLGGNIVGGPGGVDNSKTTGYTGSDGSHTHGMTQAAYSAINLDVSYVDVIVATKD